jgi:CheY-like chemotaxis protein
MRLIHRLLFVLIFLYAAAAAAVIDKEIVTGSFSTPDRAQLRNTKLETYLLQNADVAELLKQKHFTFDVKFVRGYYRSVLTHFSTDGDIPVVLQRVRQVLPDAYVITADTAAQTPSETPAVTPPAAAETAPVATTGEVDEDIVAIDETDGGAAEADGGEAVSETTVEVSSEAADNSSVVLETGSGEVAAVLEPETAPAPSEPPYLMYGIIAALVVLAILLFIAFRKPSRPTLEEMAETKRPEAEKTPLRVPEMPEEAEEAAPERETEAAAPEHEAPRPVEEAPQTAAEEIIEEAPAAVPEAVEEAPAAAETAPVRRKKRELPPDIKTATKEDLSEFAGSRVLVAEDNMINQKVITKLLEGSGIELVMADNGQIAVDMLSNDPGFDMILMDAHMPVKDGFEASRKIRGDRRFDPIVIVALSGDVSSDDIRKMREAGMEEQLAKPLRVDALYNVMYQYLDFASAQEEAPAEEEILPELKAHETDMTLNSATGLDICAGDKTMYVEILDEFVSTYAASDSLIESYINANDDVKLVQLSLDIKGVAANIGAERLSEAAETLREAVLVNQTDAYPRLAQEFKTELHQLLAAIDSFKSTL